MTFNFAMTVKGKRYLMKITSEGGGQGIEYWRVSALNKPERFILLQNDRPFVRRTTEGRHSFKWKVVHGPVRFNREHLIRQLTDGIEMHIYYQENPRQELTKNKPYEQAPDNLPY